MPNSIQRIDVAGRDVTEHMQLLFRKSGMVFHTSAEKEVVRTIKEKTCYVAPDPKKEEREWIQSGGRPDGKIVEHVLPDGNKIKVRKSPLPQCLRGLKKACRLEQRDGKHPKSCLTPNSSVWNMPESIRSLSTPSTGQIWIFGSHCLGILCFPEARPYAKVSVIGYCTRCNDWRSKICASRSLHHQSGSIARG